MTKTAKSGTRVKECEIIEAQPPERQSEVSEQLEMLRISAKDLVFVNVELAERLPQVLAYPMPTDVSDEGILDELVPLAHNLREIRISLDDARKFMVDIIQRLEL